MSVYFEVDTQLMLPGLSLREMIHDFKYQTLVLFKCCLLQPKVRDCAWEQWYSPA